MKKYYQILCILMIGVLAAGFTACSDDDDDGPGVEALQGTWVFDHGIYYMDGETLTISRSDLKQIGQEMAKYLNVSRVEFWDEVLTFKGNKVNGVEYKLKGDKFQFVGASMPKGIEVTVKVDGDNLIMHYVVKISGLKFTCDLYYDKQ